MIFLVLQDYNHIERGHMHNAVPKYDQPNQLCKWALLGRAYFERSHKSITKRKKKLRLFPPFSRNPSTLVQTAPPPPSAMATAARRLLLPALRKSLPAANGAARGVSTERAVGAAAVVGSHTAKWMQVTPHLAALQPFSGCVGSLVLSRA